MGVLCECDSSFLQIHYNINNLFAVSVYILLDSGHPAKVGECALTFHEVLDHPRNTLHGTVPVVLAHDDAEEAQHLAFMAHITPGQVRRDLLHYHVKSCLVLCSCFPC